MSEHRRAARLAISFRVRADASGRDHAGTLVELSRVGGFVETGRDLIPPMGEQVRLIIAGEPPVECETRVVTRRSRGFGFEFTATSVDLLMLLESLGAA